MARARVVLNRAGIGHLLRSGGMASEMARRAQSVASAARGNAPVDSGDYQASIHVETVTTDRAVARVVADVDYAQVVEFKTRNLGSSIDAAGG